MPYYYPIKTIRDKETQQRLIDRLLRLRGQMDAQIPLWVELRTDFSDEYLDSLR